MSLSQAKYDELLRDYDQKRLRARHLYDEKLNNVYSKVPRIKEIDDTISSLSVSTAKKLLFSSESSLDDYKKELNALRAEKESLLINNFPKDYLSYEYECNDCHDTGYIDNKKCHCLKEKIINILYEQSNLNETLKKENFSNFNLRLYAPDHTDKVTGLNALDNITQVVKTSRDFIDNFDSEFNNLLIYGATGVGKTFLSNCIAKELIDKSKSVVYLSAISLFEILANSTFDKNDFYAKEQRNNIFDCDLLIIDDLGTELVNSFSASSLFNCLNDRFLNNRSVIISTNLSLAQLRDTYSERVFSRITSNYKLLKIFGDDLRIKKAMS